MLLNIVKKLDRLPKLYKIGVLLLIDIMVLIMSYFSTNYFKDTYISPLSPEFYNTILVAGFVYAFMLYVTRTYRNITKYSSAREYVILGISCILSAIFLSLIELISSAKMLPISTNILAFIIMSIGCVTYRVVFRTIIRRHEKNKSLQVQNVLIIGAGQATSLTIKNIELDMSDEYNIIGIIDDDKNKKDCTMYGYKVIGTTKDIKKICANKKVDLILFSIHNIDDTRKAEMLNICNETDAKVKVMIQIKRLIKGKDLFNNFRDIEITDLLGRKQITLDNKEILNHIAGKTVLVTGGGGSIGSELCRQIMSFKPEKLIMLDIYENSLYEIERELEKKYGNKKLVTLVASVRDKKRLQEIFEKYKPEMVFHAAAHKHVPLMEYSPIEAIKNNVFGTNNVVECSHKYGVDTFVLISTDKAVNPTNIMGATKRICEMIIQAKDRVSKTNFVAVRFGNVLGSNGSVIPIFKKQIEEGNPITVTHKEITRYFMTIPEAVGLILQASTFASGGEIFVLDMGEPVKIYDLAKKMIKLSGKDIPIEIIGLRPGEKLYEELLVAEEGLTRTVHEKIMVSKIKDYEADKVQHNLKLLKQLVEKEQYTNDEIRELIREVVPTYTNKKNEETLEQPLQPVLQ